MSKNSEALLKLIDCYPDEQILYQALWVILTPLQQKILKAIVSNQILSVTDLGQITGIEQKTLSSQLVGMRRLGLVKANREGKRVFYFVSPERTGIRSAIEVQKL